MVKTVRTTVENTTDDALAPDADAGRFRTGIFGQIDKLIQGHDGHGEARRMSLIAFTIRVMSAGIAFLSQIFLARLMGQFEYGIFVFVWVTSLIIGTLTCFGFHTTLIRFIPQYKSRGEIAKIRGIYLTSRVFSFASASIIAALGIAFIYFFGDLITSYYVIPLVLGAFMLPMLALGDAMEGTARANNWGIQALTPTYLVRPVMIPLVMFIAVMLGFGADAKTALISALIATYTATAGQFLLLGRRLRRRYKTGPREIHLGYWLRISMPLFLVEGFYYLLTNADVIMVGLFLEPDLVATYFAAAKTMALVHFVFFAIKAGMAPRFSTLVVEAQSGELARFAASTARWTFWPTLLVGGIVLALGPFLLSLFGPDFAGGYPVMFILFAGIAAKALIGPGESLLTMSGHQKICAAVYFAVLAVNIAGNIALIPVFGIEGAAMATAFAMCVEALLLLIIIRRRLGISMHILSWPRTAGQEAN